MVDKISIYIVDRVLYKDEIIEEDIRDVMIFGVTRIVEDVPKYITILLIALVFNMLKQVCIVLAITLIYKTFIGGAHARENLTCLIYSIIYFFTPILISININLPKNILIITYIFTFVLSCYVILKHAPADTKEVPILNSKKRKLYKVLAFISLNLVYISMLLINNNIISTIILVTLIYINVIATNPAYKFFECKHSYESEEFKEYFNK